MFGNQIIVQLDGALVFVITFCLYGNMLVCVSVTVYP